MIRTYLKIKSYRQKPVSSDFRVSNKQLVILSFSYNETAKSLDSVKHGMTKNTKYTDFEIGFSEVAGQIQ